MISITNPVNYIVSVVVEASSHKMSSKELPTFARDLLDSIAEDNGFCEYTVQIKAGSPSGIDFSSEIFSITLSESNSDKRLELVCKVAPFDKEQRKNLKSHLVFEREILVYNKIMPMFEKFQEEKNVPKADQFSLYPKCYATMADEKAEQFAIILEDLRPSGFKMWNKAKPSPVENVRLAMRELGKFHALSIAMKDQRPDEFAELEQMNDVMVLFVQSNSVQDSYKRYLDLAIDSLKREEHIYIARQIKNNILLNFGDCSNEEASNRFAVLCHGNFQFLAF